MARGETYIVEIPNAETGEGDLFYVLQAAMRRAGIGGPILHNINGDMRPAFTLYDNEGWGVCRFVLRDNGVRIEIIPEYG